MDEHTIELVIPREIAAEMCVALFIMAAQAFESVPEEETPGGLIRRLEQATRSSFVTGPGRLWIEAITKAYEEAATDG